MVERCPDKTEVLGPIPSAPTIKLSRDDFRISMEFKEYQASIERYIVNRKSGIEYPVLGLCGESGEVAEKVKKVIRDCDGVLDDEIKREIAKELRDVVWYVARIGMELGFSFEEIVSMNIEKMRSRFERDAVRGRGDNR